MNRFDLTLLVVMVVISLWTIHGQQQARRLFIDLQQARDEQIHLQTEGDQLQIDKGTLSSSVRVEDIASHELGMVIPSEGSKRLLVGNREAGGHP